MSIPHCGEMVEKNTVVNIHHVAFVEGYAII